jgi:hypothetical protein
MRIWPLALAFPAALAAQTAPNEAGHARTTFRFTVNLPSAEAFPLFGAWAEQKWAPTWKPRFAYPNPPADREGAVFVVDHGSHSSVWTTTRFDIETGQVQYIYVLDRLLVTRIDIQVTAHGAGQTDVQVAYERTAVLPEAAEHVRALAKQDAGASDEWRDAINSYAARAKAGAPRP